MKLAATVKVILGQLMLQTTSNQLTCRISGTENGLRREGGELRYWSDLASRVACNASRRCRSLRPDTRNEPARLDLRKG